MELLLADDHALLREGLAEQIQTHLGIDRVRQAGDAREAIHQARVHRPALVILDTRLPLSGPWDAIRTIRSIQNSTAFILLSGWLFDSDIEQALEACVDGFVDKRDSISELISAITQVTQGRSYYCTSIRNRIEERDGKTILKSPASSSLQSLTPRERELLKYLGIGASLKEAAAAMAISYKTADNQKSSLMRKLDIHDRVQLARFTIREGLISPLCESLSPTARTPTPVIAAAYADAG